MRQFSISINERKRKVHFKIDRSKYVIPSKLFPLVNPSQVRVYTNENTTPIESSAEELQEVMEKCKFKIGSCYDNAEMFKIIAETHKIDVDVYSGWLFSTNYFPVHHVWIVANENSIIDGSILENSMSALLEVANKYGNNPKLIRDKYLNKLHELMTNEIPNYEKFIFGEIPENLMYIGTPSTAEKAREIFRKLSNFYPNHPAYKDKGMNQSGLSDLQKELHRLDK